MVNLIVENLALYEGKNWPKDEHVATSWCIGQFTGKRVGTTRIYLKHLTDHVYDKGFRWRPKYLKYIKENTSDQSDEIIFRMK